MPHRALWRVACRPKRTPPRLRGSARTIWTTLDEKAQVATRTSLARPDSPLYRGQSVGGRQARDCQAFRAARRRQDRAQGAAQGHDRRGARSEEHTSELQSLMRISYAVFCLKKKTNKATRH